MSKTVAQIFATNPTTVVADTDLYYLVQSPYTPGTDAAISGASLKAVFGTGGTVNPGLINQLGYYAAAGSTLSGLATANNGILITSAGGVPSISSTLPAAVQGNITALGTIASGVWNGTIISPTFGGTGINNGASTITIGGNVSFVGAFVSVFNFTAGTNVTFPTSGTLATTSSIPSFPLSLANGGTNAALTASNGGIVWSNATQFQILSGTATANQILLSGATATPAWSTTTYPATNAINTIMYASSANVLGVIAAANNGVLISGATGVPSMLANSVTPGFVLTANAGAPPSWQNITAEGAITTITGDAGSATPSAGAVTISGGTTGLTTNGSSATLNLTGILKLINGGTNAGLTASNGGIVWSNATQMQILAGTATANLPLLSGSTATPAWGSFALSLGGALTTAGAHTLSGAFASTFTFTNTTTVTFPTSGTLATTAQIPAFPLSLANGGTNANLTASNGGIFYSTATAGAILAGTATAQQLLMSGASTTPQWSTTTYPLTNAINTIMYASSANVQGVIAAANSGVLVTSSAGVPSILAAGTTGQMLQASTSGTPAWSTSTYPATNAINTIMYASSANVNTALATANSNMLSTNSSGVPTWIAKTGVIGSIAEQIFTATGAFTYTPTTGMQYVKIRMSGAGGAGGGAAGAVAQTAAGSGGNPGGYLEFYMTAAQIGASKTGSVGTGGTAGTAGNHPGNAGGNTTFADWTAVGGNGGTGCAASATSQFISPGAALANTAGTGTVINNISSNTSNYAFTVSTLLAVNGGAGCNPLGVDTISFAVTGTTTATGSTPLSGVKGSGGSGGVAINSATNLAGGAGGTGIVILEEYIAVQ
jgi:hypothetical protein